MHTILRSPFSLLLILLSASSISACRDQVGPIPDPGPPPPPPIVTADSSTLHDFGKSLEKWIAERDSLSLARVTDLEVLVERSFYPDTLDTDQRETMKSLLSDPQEFREMMNDFWQVCFFSTKSNFTYRFLCTRREEKGASLIFRAMYVDGRMDYIEFMLGENRQGNPVVVDVLSYLGGEYASREGYRLRQMDDRSLLKKAFDVDDTKEEVIAITLEAQLLSLAGRNSEALDLLKSIPEPYDQLRLVQALMLGVKGQVYNEKTFRKSMSIFLKKFGEDPGTNLVLIDLYTLRREGKLMLDAISRLDAIVHDPYLEVFRAQAYVILNDLEQTEAHAHAALAYDSTLVMANRILFATATYHGNVAEARGCLERLVAANYSWPGIREFLTQPDLSEVVASPEYRELAPLVERLSKPRSTAE